MLQNPSALNRMAETWSLYSRPKGRISHTQALQEASRKGAGAHRSGVALLADELTAVQDERLVADLLLKAGGCPKIAEVRRKRHVEVAALPWSLRPFFASVKGQWWPFQWVR